MKPYLAVIKDSFREALASRVLWIMLAVIGLVLAALAPFGWQARLAYQILPRDLRRIDDFAERLTRTSLIETDPAVLHIKSFLSEDLLNALKSPGSRSRNRFRLSNELTEAMEKQDFLDADAWSKVKLNDEGANLIQLGDARTEEQNRRLNRLALEALFPRFIGQVRNDTVSFTYAGFDVGMPPLPAEIVREGVQQALTVFVSLFAGTVGVFVGILVTASIIPNTFDSGSVYLLLSKPISRPLLYLSKFIGGCSFVLINASFLIVGVWLLAGLRLGEWNHRLLLCIPIFLFLFAVYYSVSGMAGLVWRNTIVCVAITVMFWFACKFVGTSKQLVDLFAHEPNRVVTVKAVDAKLFGTTNNGSLRVWDEKLATWTELVSPGFSPPGMMFDTRILPPAKDTANDRIILVRERNQLGVLAKDGNDWATTNYGNFDSPILKILHEPSGRLLAVGKDIYRISDELTLGQDVQPNIFGFKIPVLAQAKANFLVVPVTASASDNRAETTNGGKSTNLDVDGADVTMNEQNGSLVAWKSGELSVLKPNGEGYALSRKTFIEDDGQRAVLESAGNHIVLAMENGAIKLIKFNDLSVEGTFQPFGQNQPRFIFASSDGRYFAALFHSQQVWLYDTKQSLDLSDELRCQKSISGSGFAGTEGAPTFMTVDRIHRVTEYELPSLSLRSTKAAPGSVIERISWYALDPISKVFPQPTRLDETISYLMTGKETTSDRVGSSSLSRNQIKLDPWSPVWSSLGFMIVMLAASCIYIYRQDY